MSHWHTLLLPLLLLPIPRISSLFIMAATKFRRSLYTIHIKILTYQYRNSTSSEYYVIHFRNKSICTFPFPSQYIRSSLYCIEFRLNSTLSSGVTLWFEKQTCGIVHVHRLFLQIGVFWKSQYLVVFFGSDNFWQF